MDYDDRFKQILADIEAKDRHRRAKAAAQRQKHSVQRSLMTDSQTLDEDGEEEEEEGDGDAAEAAQDRWGSACQQGCCQLSCIRR